MLYRISNNPEALGYDLDTCLRILYCTVKIYSNNIFPRTAGIRKTVKEYRLPYLAGFHNTYSTGVFLVDQLDHLIKRLIHNQDIYDVYVKKAIEKVLNSDEPCADDPFKNYATSELLELVLYRYCDTIIFTSGKQNMMTLRGKRIFDLPYDSMSLRSGLLKALESGFAWNYDVGRIRRQLNYFRRIPEELCIKRYKNPEYSITLDLH